MPVKDARTTTDPEKAAAGRRARRALRALEDRTGEPILVGVAEAADFLGVRKTRVARLISQGRMPDPIASLVCGQVWLREDLRNLHGELAEVRASSNGDG